MLSGGKDGDEPISIVAKPEKPNKDNGQQTTKAATMPIQLEEIDRLRAENVQLRLMNESARSAALMRDLEASRQGIDKLQAEYMGLIKELGEKYSFNPDATEMEPGTGRVVPRGTIRR